MAGASVTAASIENSRSQPILGSQRKEMAVKNILPDCQYDKDIGGYYNTCLT